jgi:hypothetical protein
MTDGLPHVWASKRRVYIQWPQYADTPLRPTAVIQLGTPLNEILAWPKSIPADAVEFVPLKQEEGS